MPLTLRQISPPTAEPLSVTDAKQQARVTFSNDDALIQRHIQAARRYCETRTHRQYVQATYRLTMDYFPGKWLPNIPPASWQREKAWELGRWTQDRNFRLFPSPLIQVNSITYLDTNGVRQTLDPSQYVVDNQTDPARISPAYGLTWPDTLAQINAVTVTYTAGDVSPFSANATADTITVPGRTFAAGDFFRVMNSGGALPGGLTSLTDLYALGSGSTFQVSLTSGGSAIDITSAGTGDQFIGIVPESSWMAMAMMASHFYENREAVSDGTTHMVVPKTADALLDDDTVMTYL